MDTVLNTTPTYTITHTFSTDDITGTFGGLTQGDVAPGEIPVVDFTADPKVTTDGVNLYPINSEFGFKVTDFDGAIEKDFYLDPAYSEGWAGDLTGLGGEQLGLVISDAPTDSFKTPAKLGTWLAGLGGNTVKASTEHYSVMQHILSDQRYPGDPLAEYPLDDNLRVIGGKYDGELVADVIPLVGDVNGDGVADIKDVLLPNESTITENIAVSDDYSVTLKDDGKLLYRWGNTVKRPNDVRIEAELPLPDEWSEPDASNDNLIPLFKITQAELVTRHTITNNPNDQIRPEDFENESAIGQLPTYEILPDGKWVTTDDYYAGDGTLYPAGTVLKDPALAANAQGSALDQIGAMSEDLVEGYTNAWYTTMDREPFEAVLNEDGTDYVVGPRWRLQPDKYGQDLPSVVIPNDPSLPPPPTKDEVKYEVGEDTQTVINLLDWEFPTSPLAISAGWQNNSGSVSINGLNMTENFDVAFYIKGDIKPATIYDTQLVMSYEAVALNDRGASVVGTAGDDQLVGLGNNVMTGDSSASDAGEDLFVLSYGVTNDYTQIASSTITDFQRGEDVIGLIDLSVTDINFNQLVSQSVEADGLHVSLGAFEVATLSGVTTELAVQDFLLMNRSSDATISGTSGADYLVGDDFDNVITGFASNDTLLGLGGNDLLIGNAGDDTLDGGDGDDELIGGIGADTLIGGAGRDTASYSSSVNAVEISLKDATAGGGMATGDTLTGIENLTGTNSADTLVGNYFANTLTGGGGNDSLQGMKGRDLLIGAAGADTLDGGDGIDRVKYVDSSAGVSVDLEAAIATGGDAEGDILIAIENVIGSLHADTLTGDTQDNVLRGSQGNDLLIGKQGADALYGGLGADTLRGGAGNDQLDGRSGADQMFGGDGNDVFLFNAGSDQIDGGDGADTAYFTGLRSDFTVVDNGAGSWSVTEIASGDTDVLVNVETLSFDDVLILA